MAQDESQPQTSHKDTHQQEQNPALDGQPGRNRRRPASYTGGAGRGEDWMVCGDPGLRRNIRKVYADSPHFATNREK